jgi:hypothetical protein
MMTDNEIIKALECCTSDGVTCDECPYEYTKHIVGEEFETMPNGKSYDDLSCDEWHKIDLLNLINRQKAEIERLKKVNDIRLECLGRSRAKAKAEAIKEFWSRLQGVAYQSEREWSHGEHPMLIELDDAKEIYEEMAGDV